MNNLNQLATVIVRSVGERTEQLCRQLIVAQGFAPDNVATVNLTPFSAAFRKCCEIGIERDRRWTFCVDADTLLRPGAAAELLRQAERQAGEVCEIQGWIIDKLFDGPRQAGNHLYRTSMLPHIIAAIPTESVDVRPERHTLQRMHDQGFPWREVPVVLGIHDFEQSYRDLFRKCFVHARKHIRQTDYLIPLWRRKAEQDQDFLIAVKGFAGGLESLGETLIDASQPVYSELFSRLEIEEKSTLSAQSISPETIGDMVDHWHSGPEYRAKFAKRNQTQLGRGEPSSASFFQAFKKNLQDVGPGKILPHYAGWLLKNCGERMFKWSCR